MMNEHTAINTDHPRTSILWNLTTMKTPFLPSVLIALIIASHGTDSVAAVTTNDLRTDWSDTQNPNGVWS
jgi:hypothetical protein